MVSERAEEGQAFRSEKSVAAPRLGLLIPATATVALAFGGAGCDEESREEIYERVCEKLQECQPERFSPGEMDDFYASIEECAEQNLTYVTELAADYTRTAECYEALLDLYDCYMGAYANLDGCGEYYEELPSPCVDEYDNTYASCYDGGFAYYE